MLFVDYIIYKYPQFNQQRFFIGGRFEKIGRR